MTEPRGKRLNVSKQSGCENHVPGQSEQPDVRTGGLRKKGTQRNPGSVSG